jgi:hypothetical protein
MFVTTTLRRKNDPLGTQRTLSDILSQGSTPSFFRIVQDIKDQLIEELAEIEWNEIVPHAQRDAVIVVSESLPIVDVGVALAKDDVASVQNWIAEQLIHKPSVEQLSNWNSKPEKKFQALIVQPFVLVSAA